MLHDVCDVLAGDLKGIMPFVLFSWQYQATLNKATLYETKAPFLDTNWHGNYT